MSLDCKIAELEERIGKFENILIEIKNELKKQNGKTMDEVRATPTRDAEASLPSTERAKIEDIIRDFNFEKVHRVMEMLNWKWAATSYGVPTIEELKGEARRLLVEAATEETQVATGGFRAVYEKSQDCAFDPDPYIGLEFIVEECEGFVDDDEDGSVGVEEDEN